MALTPAYQPANPFRAIRWRHPPRITYPQPIEHAVAWLAAATAEPHGQRFQKLFDGAPAAGGVRQRAKRIDGATNVATLLSTLIASSDLMSGIVAVPGGAEGRRWRRRSWEDLGTLGFGAPVAGQVSTRRTDRAAAELVAQGYVRVTQWRVVQDGEMRSVPGAKIITEKFWRAIGLWGAVQGERRRKARIREQARAGELASLAGKLRPERKPSPSPSPSPAEAQRQDGGQHHDPPAASERRTETAVAELEKMRKILGSR